MSRASRASDPGSTPPPAGRPRDPQAIRGRPGTRRRRPGGPPRRGPCPGGGERGRQEHPHAYPGRGPSARRRVPGMGRPTSSTAFGDERDAQRAGIAIVFQERSLFGPLSIAENIFAARQPVGRWGLIDRRELRRRSRDLLARVGLDADPDDARRTPLPGPAATRRDRQGPLDRRPADHLRRADRRPDGRRDGDVVRGDPPTPRAAARRDLHLAPARGDLPDRRPRDRAQGRLGRGYVPGPAR